jgi:hypothetical protein
MKPNASDKADRDAAARLLVTAQHHIRCGARRAGVRCGAQRVIDESLTTYAVDP